MGKKNRAELEVEVEPDLEVANGDSRKKHKKKKKKKKIEQVKSEIQLEKPTVSVAVPGSIIDNAQSLELATRLAGQIARAVTIFRIDEVVVFDNKSNGTNDSGVATGDNSDDDESGAAFLVRILQYLETPQYLRKALFPKHNNLRFVGMLPPLDAPHHLRKHEWAQYRDGVALKERAPNSVGTLVDVGLSKNVVINQMLEPGMRVTVAMGTNRSLDFDLPRQVVPSSEPREKAGMYWGYKVRYPPTLSSVFNACPYKGGYDNLIGTSEHGSVGSSSEFSLQTFRHLLIAFGGLAGLEESIEEDHSLKGKNAREVFNSYVNTCPNQGSRTIRTEVLCWNLIGPLPAGKQLFSNMYVWKQEAIFISLQYFQEPIKRALSRAGPVNFS